MSRLALGPIAPVLGRKVPLRGPARLLRWSYARARPARRSGPSRATTQAGDAFRVDLASCLEWQLWAFGGYEAHFAELFAALVAPGDQCIDVGANVGVHTIRLARLAGAAGRVIAVEPDRALARRLAGNLALNRLANVRVVTAAADRHGGGRAVLHRPADEASNRGVASLRSHPHLTGPAEDVPTVALDELTAGPVALIKVDVEGHEAAVLAGARSLIAGSRPAVIFEYEPGFTAGPADTPFGWLAGAGYQMFRISQRRHPVTGRGRLRLDPLTRLPDAGADVLAVPADTAARFAAGPQSGREGRRLRGAEPGRPISWSPS